MQASFGELVGTSDMVVVSQALGTGEKQELALETRELTPVVEPEPAMACGASDLAYEATAASMTSGIACGSCY